MSFSRHVYTRSYTSSEALEWLYENPEGATFVYRDGELVERTGPADWTTLRALERSGDVWQQGRRPARFSKANRAGEFQVTFTLSEATRANIRWDRETPVHEKAAVIVSRSAMETDDHQVDSLIAAAAMWLRTEGAKIAAKGKEKAA